jgi:phosphatidylethanolamine/phosphatidyl-N-methylethanolamine N-methyltransferase
MSSAPRPERHAGLNKIVKSVMFSGQHKRPLQGGAPKSRSILDAMATESSTRDRSPADGTASAETMARNQRATELERRRYDRLAWLYEAFQLPAELLFQARLRRRAFEVIPDGARVLEVGVGTGLNLPHYPTHARVTAIDLSPRMLDRARRRTQRLGLEVTLNVADAQALPFADGTFDWVVATFVFCSVPDPATGLAELTRVCRPHGRILMVEHVRPRGPLAGFLADLLDPLIYRLMGFHINRRTVESMRAAGMVLETVEESAGVYRTIKARPPGAAGSAEQQ